MKNYKYIGLFLLSLSLVNCTENNVTDEIVDNSPFVEISTGQANVSSYVAIGASFSAGFTDNALFKLAQENSFPNILSKRFGGTFNQPLMNDNVGGLTLAGNVIQGPRLYFNGSGPAPASGTPSTEVTAGAPGGPFHNFGIPGAKSFHMVAPGYGNVQGVALGLANPYFARMASSPTATVLGDAMAQNPTFFTLSEIGGNDVLGYALSGGSGVVQTGNLDPATYGGSDITDPNVFAQVFNGLVSTLTSNGAKGVVGNVPYITSLAHFTTVPYNAVPLDAATAGALNNAFATYNAGLDQVLAAKNANLLPPSVLPLLANFDQAEVDRRKINFAAGQNAVLILDENLSNLSLINPGLTNMRQATADDLLVLTSSSFIGTPADPNNPLLINGVSVPLADRWVLTPEEQNSILTATDAYNAVIEAAASSNPDIALVDFKGILNQATTGIQFGEYNMNTALVSGGLISLDGVHLTARGYALMANKIMEAMDINFGSNFRVATNGLADPNDHGTNYPRELPN